MKELITAGYKQLCDVPYYVESTIPRKRYEAKLTIWYHDINKYFAVSTACPIGTHTSEYVYCSEDRLKVCLHEFEASLELDYMISKFGYLEDPVTLVNNLLKKNKTSTISTNRKSVKATWLPVEDLDDYDDILEFTIEDILVDVERKLNLDGRALTLDPDDYEDMDLIKTATDFVVEGASQGESRDVVIDKIVDHMIDFTYPI